MPAATRTGRVAYPALQPFWCAAGFFFSALLLLEPLALGAQAAQPPAFNNTSVVELHEARLPTSVIVAKVRQAPNPDFSVTTDDLIALSVAGIDPDVIEAMVERSTVESPSGVFGEPAASTPAGTFAPDADLGINTVRVALETADGPIRLQALGGEMTVNQVMGFGPTFMDYPGSVARRRTTERRPTLLIQSTSPLEGGRSFLVRVDSDVDDGVRSLKISSSKRRFKTMWGGSSRGFSEPDEDWVYEFSSEEIETNLWRVVPAETLEPGEYGWYVDLGTGRQAAVLFSFGID